MRGIITQKSMKSNAIGGRKRAVGGNILFVEKGAGLHGRGRNLNLKNM
jgi:hypothetical protein